MTVPAVFQGNIPIKPPRLAGIELFRYLGFLAIVILHCAASIPLNHELKGVIDNLTRFAVPFFFLAGGYFLPLNPTSLFSSIFKIAIRLLPIFIFWFIVYTVAYGDKEKLMDIKYILSGLYWGGDGYHLWFLPAFGVSAVCVLVTRELGWAFAFFCAIILYMIGLAFTPYREVFDFPNLFTRNGPFFGFFFMLAGSFIRYKDIQIPNFKAISILLFGLLLIFTESIFLYRTGYGSLNNDFLFGTAFLGIGVFLLAKNVDLSHSREASLMLGKAVLGMYCIHLLFLKFYIEALKPAGIAEFVQATIFVIIASTIASLALNRVSFLSRIIR